MSDRDDQALEDTLVSGGPGPDDPEEGSREVTDFGDYVRTGDSSTGDETDVDAGGERSSPGRVSPPSWIGPYRILERLGAGGMGVVYRAEQREPIHREVAIKVIRAAIGGEQARFRFEAERQALARMTHPAIAKVFEAGDTPSGEPYFAMELVQGEPIDRYCTNHALGVEERLRLVISVCQGVQHAHQKGILHRDIKPANILVATEDGKAIPKLIDFGVAKALDDGEEALTELGVVVGTPSYVSPETLANQRDADTRTDVYALGVLLFELLTGSRPYGRRGDSALVIFREISETEAAPPSRHWNGLRAEVREQRSAAWGTQPAAHGRRLQGDLDWIVGKAMHREREHRYPSAAELAADLERHLTDQPVVAGPPGRLYRAGKFVRRRKGSVLAAALLFLSLCGGIVARTVEARRANAAAETARLAAVEAEEVVSFLVDLFRVSNPSESLGASITAREILDRGLIEIRGRLLDQPLPRARLLDTMGLVYQQLGLLSEARPLLEESLSLREAILPASSGEVAESVRRLGHHHWLAGDYPLAERFLLRALALLEAQPEADSVALAKTLDDLGSVYNVRARYEEAESLQRRALALREAHFGSDSLEVAASLDDLAVIFSDQGRSEESLGYTLRALEIRRDQLGPEHPEVAGSANTTAINYFLLGRWDEALALFQEALAIRQRVLPPDHPDVGQSLSNLAEAYLLSGREDEAEAPMRQALEIWEKALGPDHRRVGVAVQNLAGLAHRRGQLEEAERHYLRAKAIFEGSLGSEHPTVASTLMGLGEVRFDRGQPAEALALYRRALEIRTLALPPGSEPLVESREAVARIEALSSAQ